MINSGYDRNIRIWNFHTGKLINKVSVNLMNIRSLFLYENKYFMAGSGYNNIDIYDLEKKEWVGSLQGHSSDIICIKSIKHPLYGECLISQGYKEKIKLWINKK